MELDPTSMAAMRRLVAELGAKVTVRAATDAQ
jgi:hypothetical protein